MPRKGQAVGYIRVSTREQEADGAGLPKQMKAIREAAAARGLDLIYIYQDTGSAVGKGSHLKRRGLQDAITMARLKKVPLIVWRLHRLSREPEVIEELRTMKGLRIISCDMNEMLSPAVIRKKAERARRTAENISTGTAAGHARRKARGERSGRTDLEGLKDARELAKETIQTKKDEHREHLVAVLQRHPELRNMSAAEVAERLNTMGIFSGRGLPWTKEGIRRPLREAKALLQERQELAALPFDDFDGPGAQTAHEEVKNHPYKDHPNYGMFS